VAFHRVVGADVGASSARVAIWDDAQQQAVPIPDTAGTPLAIREDLRGLGTSLASPPDTLSAVFAALRLRAGSFVSGAVVDLCLCVPSWLDEAERQALVVAANLGGFETIHLVDEGVAAAVSAFAGTPETSLPSRLAVFSLGAGTCSVSIVRRDAGDWTVLGAAGDRGIGGLDFDERIVGDIVGRIKEAHGIDVSTSAAVLSALRQKAERAKRQLSVDEETLIWGLPIAEWPAAWFRVNRPTFEALIGELLDKAVACLERAVDQARELAGDGPITVDRLLFVGGATATPSLRACVISRLGLSDNAVIRTDHPEWTTCCGAATLARQFKATRYPFLDEKVQFSAYRPSAVKPDQWYTLLAFAHLSKRLPDASPSEPDPLEEVKQQAALALGEQGHEYKEPTQDGQHAAPRNGELTFVPEMPGIEFNPPSRNFLWLESVHREGFRLRASAASVGRILRGRLSVFHGAVVLADVPLTLRVESAPAEAETAPTTVERAGRYRRIFASYSHQDLWVAKEFERYARMAGDRYLRDSVDLRAGEEWSDRLRQVIADAETFQLFWSASAMASPFVQQEWECALALGRHDFIRLVHWEDPLPESPDGALPPAALRQQHVSRLIRPAAEPTDQNEPQDDGAMSELTRLEQDARGAQPPVEEPRRDTTEPFRQMMEQAAAIIDPQKKLAELPRLLSEDSPGPVFWITAAVAVLAVAIIVVTVFFLVRAC
jgi:actin-like ATPase involved in cell morphogenesis